jgi:hypothetical protein
MQRYADPFRFAGSEAVLRTIGDSRHADLGSARAIPAERLSSGAAAYVLPDAAWSRRVRGAFGNELARAFPQRAHAVLTRSSAGYAVSVRSALERPGGADALCRKFGGGGRQAAAGIDRLGEPDFDRFIQAFREAYG